jgi:hypothetical protein
LIVGLSTDSDYLIASQLHFKVVPASLGATAMAEVRTSANGNVQFELIVRLSLGWLFTKGTVLENDMGSRATSILFWNAVIGAMLENLLFRDIHGVVTRHKDFGSHLCSMNTLWCGR